MKNKWILIYTPAQQFEFGKKAAEHEEVKMPISVASTSHLCLLWQMFMITMLLRSN